MVDKAIKNSDGFRIKSDIRRELKTIKNKYSATLIDSIYKWHQDFHVNGTLPKGYIEKNLIDIYLDKKNEHEAFKKIQEREFFDSKKPPRILDVGSGLGKFVSVCNEKGYNCVGLEPSQKACSLAKEILKEEGCYRENLVCGTGEELPFPSESFDVVVSITVLEHVKDVRKTITECLRVLKKNGIFYLLVPNFLSFWEGHYRVFFIPYLLSLKSAFKFYVRLRGRKKECADSINFNINPFYLNSLLNSLGISKIENVGIQRFCQKFNNPDYIVDPRISKLVKLLTRFWIMKLLGRLGIKLIEVLEIYTPIILIIEK